jgi:hypothetical protein
LAYLVNILLNDAHKEYKVAERERERERELQRGREYIIQFNNEKHTYNDVSHERDISWCQPPYITKKACNLIKSTWDITLFRPVTQKCNTLQYEHYKT